MTIPNVAHLKGASTGSTDVTFTVPAADPASSLDVLGQAQGAIGYAELAMRMLHKAYGLDAEAAA